MGCTCRSKGPASRTGTCGHTAPALTLQSRRGEQSRKTGTRSPGSPVLVMASPGVPSKQTFSQWDRGPLPGPGDPRQKAGPVGRGPVGPSCTKPLSLLRLPQEPRGVNQALGAEERVLPPVTAATHKSCEPGELYTTAPLGALSEYIVAAAHDKISRAAGSCLPRRRPETGTRREGARFLAEMGLDFRTHVCRESEESNRAQSQLCG